jgi:hypothetical protein
MRRITTITGPDGRVTRITTRGSGCGCLTILAAVVVLFGPAAWFGVVGATIAYAVLGFIAVIAGAEWLLRTMRWPLRKTAPTPPPVPAAPPVPPVP